MTRSHILVVDDEPANRRLLEVLLAAAGYRVSQAERGAEAVERVAAGGIDLVLLDVMMPGMDGVETCRLIRARHPMLPVVIATALADQASRTRGKEAGADDFLTKPIYEDELLARIRSLLTKQSLYESLQEERLRAQQSAGRWRAVSNLASAATKCRDYAALADCIKASTEELLPFSSFAFIEIETRHRVDLAREERPSADASHRVVSVPESLRASLTREFLARGTLNVADALSADIAALVQPVRGSCAVLLPVYVANELCGVVQLSTSRELSGAEIALTAQIAPHVSNAVANVRAHVAARELSAARERLASFLVHDLKNPLSIMAANLDVFTSCPLSDDERTEIIRECKSATRRMHSMVLELLDVARAEERGLGLHREVLDLDSIVQTVHAEYRRRATELGVTLHAGSAPGANVLGDCSFLTRVVENIVGNAFRYVSRDGVIELSLQERTDHWSLSIGNDGPTIPEHIRVRLFEKYNTGATGSPGRGIGLYFCRLVIEEHGGSIRARTRAGGGVRFEICIPKVQYAASYRASFAASHAPRPCPSTPPSGAPPTC